MRRELGETETLVAELGDYTVTFWRSIVEHFRVYNKREVYVSAYVPGIGWNCAYESPEPVRTFVESYARLIS